MTVEKTFPSSSRFLLVEDIRKEEGTNKATLVGVFAGDDVILLDKGSKNDKVVSEKTVLPVLSFFGLLSGGEGNFTATFKIFGPDGTSPIVTGELQPISIKSGMNAVLAIKLSPFYIQGFGDYRLDVTLDDTQTYSYSFRIGKLTVSDISK